MRITIIGHGSLGTLYGHAFSRISEHRVIYIARGERAEKLKKNPLQVNGDRFDYAVENPEDNREPAGLIIFAVKYHHLRQALEDVRAHAGKDTIFVSVMNGIDSEEIIDQAFGPAHVLHTVALGMDAVRVENRTTFTKQGKLLFGRAGLPHSSNAIHGPGGKGSEPSPASETSFPDKPRISDPDVRTFADLCDQAGLAYENPPDILRKLWSKFMLNIGANQVSAVLEAPYGPFQRDTRAQKIMRRRYERVEGHRHSRAEYKDFEGNSSVHGL
jgi:2-dehydropantoate 2-reductase